MGFKFTRSRFRPSAPAPAIMKERGERMTHIMFETFCVSDMSETFYVSAVEVVFHVFLLLYADFNFI